MIEKLIIKDTLPEAYHESLKTLNEFGEICDCGDWNCKQKELSLTFQVLNPIQEPRISKLFIGGPKELEQYRQEMLFGIMDFEVERGNWTYTYHQRYAKQISFVIDELKRNPSTRRAIMLVRDNSVDMGSDDPACLQHIQYFIRNGKLDCEVLFRSNDACKATFMNAFALICLQQMIAGELRIPIGTYTHRANSFHCYEKDFELLNGYCNRLNSDDHITYDYIGEWDELMEMYEYEINQQVEQLKNR